MSADLKLALSPSQETQLHKLEKRLRRHVGQAIAQYNMIEDGDKIIVKSTTNMIHIRALMMSQKDAAEYRTPEYLETDKKYKKGLFD